MVTVQAGVSVERAVVDGHDDAEVVITGTGCRTASAYDLSPTVARGS